MRASVVAMLLVQLKSIAADAYKRHWAHLVHTRTRRAMASFARRRMIVAAALGLVLWLILWLLAFAILPAGQSFNLLYFGIAEPLLVSLPVFLLPDAWFWSAVILLVLVSIQFILYVIEFIWRATLVTRPFDVAQLGDIIFLLLDFFVVIVYIWFVAASVANLFYAISRRNYYAAMGGTPPDVETPGGVYNTAPLGPPQGTVPFGGTVGATTTATTAAPTYNFGVTHRAVAKKTE
jgi:hypothetical protein